jgi:3-oxoacyl-[acyl-carrier protein] reductase
LKELCVKKNQEHDMLSIDMCDHNTVLKTFSKYHNANSVDIVINNSGGPAGGLAHTADVSEYISAFGQHVLTAQAICQVALGSMKRKRFGRIINIISTSVKQPIAGLGVSNTVRGAMANWSKTLSSEVGQFGITVNNILPGATETDRLRELIESSSKKMGVSNQSIIDQMKSNIPVGRFAESKEIAHAIVFLCSSFAGYINGINLPIDGGRTKCL